MAGDNRFEVEVLTPEGEVFSGEVRQVSTRTAVGEVGILANHAPLLAALHPAELRLHVTDSETKRYAQAHGWLQVLRQPRQAAGRGGDCARGSRYGQAERAAGRCRAAAERVRGGQRCQGAGAEGPKQGRSVSRDSRGVSGAIQRLSGGIDVARASRLATDFERDLRSRRHQIAYRRLRRHSGGEALDRPMTAGGASDFDPTPAGSISDARGARTRKALR